MNTMNVMKRFLAVLARPSTSIAAIDVHALQFGFLPGDNSSSIETVTRNRDVRHGGLREAPSIRGEGQQSSAQGRLSKKR